MVIFILLTLVAIASMQLEISDGSYININTNGNLVTDNIIGNWAIGQAQSGLFSKPNSPAPKMTDLGLCTDLSSCFGNKLGNKPDSFSTPTKYSLKSTTLNSTAEVKNTASPNSSTYGIVLTNTNKSAPLNVSGWEISTTSLNGNKKNLSLSNGTLISPSGSLVVSSSLAAEPRSIILRDATGSVMRENSTIPISIGWQKAS